MDNYLKFLIELYADSKIKQIRKNSFRDEKAEIKLMLENLVNSWFDKNYDELKSSINFDKLEKIIDKDAYIQNLIDPGLRLEARRKLFLIKRLADYRGERWYEEESVDSPRTYTNVGKAISGLLMAVTSLGEDRVFSMVSPLVREIENLDTPTKAAIWVAPTILGMMIDAFKRLK
jgi:hypothetical protein